MCFWKTVGLRELDTSVSLRGLTNAASYVWFGFDEHLSLTQGAARMLLLGLRHDLHVQYTSTEQYWG